MNNGDVDITEDFDALLERLSAGDEAAFNTIYKLYAQRMLFFALRTTKEEDAKDAVAEAFIALWERRSNFTNMAALQHFLFITVRNQCVNLVKREEVRHHNQSGLLYQLENAEESALNVEKLSGDLVSYVYREIEKLPPRQQEIFMLAFREGLKPAQIAEKLGLSVQTVSNQKFTIIRLLRQALGSQAHLLGFILFSIMENKR